MPSSYVDLRQNKLEIDPLTSLHTDVKFWPKLKHTSIATFCFGRKPGICYLNTVPSVQAYVNYTLAGMLAFVNN
jgi:hypothetical protein